MRVCVTGSQGFVGRALVRRLLESGHDVLGVDSREGEGNFNQLMLRASALAEHHLTGCDVVFHLEWSGSFKKAAAEPISTAIENLGTLRHMLDIAERSRCKFIFASSSLVYGGNLDHPAKEDEDVAPRAAYGQQKLQAEALVEEFGGFNVRIFNVFGKGSTDVNQIIPRLLAAGASDGKIFLNGDGMQKRDFVHVKDVARGLELLVSHTSTGTTFNLSSGVGTSMLDLANMVFQQVGRTPEIIWRPAIEGEARVICGDSSALQRATGWQPEVSLADGILELFR